MRLIDKVSPERLKELYWDRKMSSYEIAKIYQRTAARTLIGINYI